MYIEVEGGAKAAGELTVQGSKNAVLPIMAASVLTRQTTVLENCPQIQDVYSMISILKSIGADVRWQDDKLVIDASMADNTKIDGEAAGELRASVLLLGSMLGRCGEAAIRMPGGCSIGARPIDYHIRALETLGVAVTQTEEMVFGKKVNGGEETVLLPYPSVGATENVLLYAVQRKGKTVIKNAAREPEICELSEFLRRMGAAIQGDGEKTILVEGVSDLHGATYRLNTDRIAFLTYAAMAAATGGSACFKVCGEPFAVEQKYMEWIGCRFEREGDCIRVLAENGIHPIPHVRTGPYPQFPTDIQSLFLTLFARTSGESVIEESVFENRFQVANQLRKMGADIEIIGQCAYVRGVTKLHGEKVKATDLRSGAALLLAGVLAEGKTRIENPEVIFRGYQAPVENIQNLGICARYVTV